MELLMKMLKICETFHRAAPLANNKAAKDLLELPYNPKDRII